MAEPASDYHRGEMDIHEQTATYHGFLALSKWLSLALAAFLVFAVLLFCTPAGFIGSAVTTVVVTVIGFMLLRSKPAAH